MNKYQEEMLRFIVDNLEMDGARVMTISDADLKQVTFESDPMIEIAFALEEISMN